MSATTFRSVSSAILFAGALVVGSCNNDPGIMSAGGNGGGNTPNPPGGGGNGGSTNGGKGGNGVPNPPGGGGTNGGGGTTGAGGAGGPEKCTAVAAKAMQLPVDILVVLDRSGSMLNDINDDGSMGNNPPPTPGVPIKWDSMVEALTKFVNAPSASGLQLGLEVFPRQSQMICGRRNCCDAAGYAMPVVPVTALPAGAMAFLGGVMANPAQMGNGTPTLPALQGAIQYAQQRESMVGRRLAIALATDGVPNDCNSNVQNVSDAAQMGAGLGIYTFVIGVGKSLMNLNQIAMAGGTKQAFLVEMATADQLAAAFKAVQNQAAMLACSYMIPPAPAGMSLDPNKVNVRFTPPAPATSYQIGQVANRMACGTTGGWYFDNAQNPRTVNLCEASCMSVNTSGGGSIDVEFGCAGVIIK